MNSRNTENEFTKGLCDFTANEPGPTGDAGQVDAADQNGHGHGQAMDLLTAACLAGKMPKSSALAFGAKTVKGRLCFPSWGPLGEALGEFRIKPGSSGRWMRGSTAGLFLPLMTDGKPQVPLAGEQWVVCSNLEDAIAMHGAGFSAVGVRDGKLSTDFAPILRGVNVVVLPTGDDAIDEVATDVAARLHDIVATVKKAALPEGVATARDLLLTDGGAELLKQAISEAQPVEAEESEAGGGIIKKLADSICKTEHFTQDEGQLLYSFCDGVYKAGGEELVRRHVKALLNEWEMTALWTRVLGEHVAEYIRVDSPRLWERPPLDVLNLKNGLLDVATRKLRPHDPAHLSPVQLPVNYDPAAKCPAIEKFVSEVFPVDATALAWEIPAYVMLADTSIQKAVLLQGSGGNGKSTWLAMLMAFLGRGNTSSLSLHQLESDRFSVARLCGKLANICPDLPSKHLEGTSVFKRLTGGDQMSGENKFKPLFEFTPFCRLVFSANNPPRSEDSSAGFFERWLVLVFERAFRGTTGEVSRNVLDATLAAPGELSGLLNKALDALPQIQSGKGFSRSESTDRAWREFHATTDPLAVWLDRYTYDGPAALAVRNTFRVAFNASLESSGKPAMTQTAFGLEFAKLRPHVEAKQRTVNGKMQWCYIGIGLLSDTPDDSQPSQGSQSPHTCYLSPACAGNEWEGEEEKEEREENNKLDNPVNPVSHVSRPACNHLNPASWVSDGKRRLCPACGKFMGAIAE